MKAKQRTKKNYAGKVKANPIFAETTPLKPSVGRVENKFNIFNSKHLWICVGIAVLTIFVFYPVVTFDFVDWDDPSYVLDNPYLKVLSFNNMFVYFKQFYFLMYLPLTMLTYVMDVAIAGGLKPGMFHFTNLILHLFNTTMVFIVVSRLESELRSKKNWLIPTIVSALFGVATTHVESVAWIAERKDLLYTAFYLCSLYAYLIYSRKKTIGYYYLSLLLFLCSLVSKAQAFPFAFILIFLDGLLHGTYFDRKRWVEKIPFLALALFFAALAVLGNHTETENFQKLEFTFLERIAFASYSYITYVVKLFVPYHLSAIYSFPVKVDGNIPSIYWLFLFPVMAVIVILIFMLKKNQRVAFGIVFYSFSIGIVLQIFAYHDFIMADRYSYVSSIGIFYLLAYGLNELSLIKPLTRLPILIAFALYILSLSYATSTRLNCWKNSDTLWTDVIEKDKNSSLGGRNTSMAYGNRAFYKSSKGDFNGALADYDKALALRPTFKMALLDRGILRAKMNDNKGSLEDFKAVAKLDPKSQSIYFKIGNAMLALGDTLAAIKEYDKELSLWPNSQDVIYNRGQAQYFSKHFEKAASDFKFLVSLNQNYPKAHYFLGMTFFNLHQPIEAISNLNFEISRVPNNFEAIYARAACHFQLKHLDESLSDFGIVIKNYPQNPMPYYQRAFVYLEKGMKNQACDDFKQAVQLGYAQAQQDLAMYCK